VAYAKTSERREKRLLREQMRAMGLGYRDIAAEFARQYNMRPRAAWREAYGWSLQDASDRINAFRGDTGLDPGGIASMTAPHLSEYENWPGHRPQPTGRRPTPYLLAVLAAVYDCAVADLIDLADRQHLRPADLLILDKYSQATKPASMALPATDEARVNPTFARDGLAGSEPAGMAEPADVIAWVAATSTSDDAISELARTAEYLADAHARIPAGRLLREVLGAHREAHALLLRGRQRLAQARELLRIESALMAHACLLLGDLGDYATARAHGRAALLCAREAGAEEGLAWTAMAKTARWQNRFAEAGTLAARGFEAARLAPIQAELAYREANAIALFGDALRARAAFRKASQAAENLDDDGTSAWSFSRGRQAVFALSVCVHTGDPDGALRAAREADAYWDAGGGKITATWAQVRAGAAMAYLLKDSLDGAADQLGPVLDLPPDQRISTITGYLHQVSQILQSPHWGQSPLAMQLGSQIKDFTSTAATTAAGR